MSESDKALSPQVSDRQRAIVEAGLLIGALADERPDVQQIKDVWYRVGLRVRAAIAEIRQSEPTQLQRTQKPIERS